MFECRRCGTRFEGGSNCLCFTLCEECGEEAIMEITELMGFRV